MQNHQRRALVLFSGGQDSTTCLAWALDRYAHVETVAFDYGQRHHIELSARLNVLREIRENFPDWAPRLGEDHENARLLAERLGVDPADCLVCEDAPSGVAAARAAGQSAACVPVRRSESSVRTGQANRRRP